MFKIDRRNTLLGAGAMGFFAPAFSSAIAAANRDRAPQDGWEREPMRWFQLAFTEDDTGNFDPQFWMNYFREIGAEGVCLSAGGSIAFYPTQIPYHGKSINLEGNDPFGTMVEACKSEGMRVIARIDPHAISTEAFAAHPEWASFNQDGTVRRHPTASDLYQTCCYGSHNFEFMPKVIDEIARLYPVDGFFGNRWRRLDVCYCETCKSLYAEATGRGLPETEDPIHEGARVWHEWSQRRMLALIDLWNSVIIRHRPGAFFTPGGDRHALVDFDGAELGERLPLTFADRQARSMHESWFSVGTEAWNSGRVAKELRAWMFDKPIGHIVSVGVEEEYRWKDSVQSGDEIRIWAAGSIAHGARPWITKFNAKPFDRRWMSVVKDIYGWHNKNERYLRNTENLSNIAMVASTLGDSYVGGRDKRRYYAGHSRGYYQALLEAAIPFDMIDDAYLDEEHLSRFDVLILANAMILTDKQCDQLRAFVQQGGSLVATHETSLYDLDGKRRDDFGLADLFGCHYAGVVDERMQNAYLTLRHPHSSLNSLENVRRTIASVKRVHVETDGHSEVPLTLVPSYPDLPMERVFTDVTESDIPMALCRSFGNGGRVVYLPMDLDRTYDELVHRDHLHLLAGMVRWALNKRAPMEVEGPGLFDMSYWRQENSLTAHIVNLNNPMTMRGSYRETIPTGPYEISLELPQGATPKRAHLLEAQKKADFRVKNGRLTVIAPQVNIHEIVAIDLV